MSRVWQVLLMVTTVVGCLALVVAIFAWSAGELRTHGLAAQRLPDDLEKTLDAEVPWSPPISKPSPDMFAESGSEAVMHRCPSGWEAILDSSNANQANARAPRDGPSAELSRTEAGRLPTLPKTRVLWDHHPDLAHWDNDGDGCVDRIDSIEMRIAAAAEIPAPFPPGVAYCTDGGALRGTGLTDDDFVTIFIDYTGGMASVIEFKLEDLAAAEGEAVEALLMGIGVSPNDCAGVDHHLEPGVLVDFLRSFPLRGVGGVPVPIEARTAAQIVSALQPGEELWVISRDKSARTPAELPEDHPGTGELRAKVKEQMIPLPLAHTAVQAAIAGYIATVDVTQQYHNPYDEKIEAVYVFPLPQDAAVNEFVMTVGERKIRGIIRERDEAEEIYEQAKSAGHVASLLTQERPNIFTQSVANIEPGKRIDISIKYFNTLAYADGWYEFVFPMVVGPRFNPPGSTDGVGAVARDKTGSSGQATEVPYLRPSERSGHDIAMTVRIDAGVSIEALDCVNHEITAEALDEARAVVQLDPADSIPNKDFILRYKVAGGHVKTAFVTHRDERGGFFTLMLVPPADLADLERKPMEMVFVLDCSGSMDGQPIAQAKAAAAQALRMMRPDDTFQIIRFSNNASQLGPAPLPATEANIARGLEYLASLEGSGGTMMIEGIKAALDFPHDPRRMRTVAFLTDGFIGNEAEILGEVYQRLGASRIFSFGVGSSPNRYLLDRLAVLGKGAVAYLSLNGNAEEIMTLYFDRISHPGLTNLTIDWGTLNVHDVYPRRLPDLFVGRPVIVNGRFEGAEPTTIAIHGRVTDEERVYELDVDPTDVSAQHHGLAAVWARMKIKDLMTRNTYLKDDIELPQMIKEVALAYSLMSQYTAFVAVDSMTVTAGDHGTTVEVPVPVPEGVRYETTVVEDEVAAGVGS